MMGIAYESMLIIAVYEEKDYKNSTCIIRGKKSENHMMNEIIWAVLEYGLPIFCIFRRKTYSTMPITEK